jgi:hypothetical protein
MFRAFQLLKVMFKTANLQCHGSKAHCNFQPRKGGPPRPGVTRSVLSSHSDSYPGPDSYASVKLIPSLCWTRVTSPPSWSSVGTGKGPGEGPECPAWSICAARGPGPVNRARKPQRSVASSLAACGGSSGRESGPGWQRSSRFSRIIQW